MTNAPEPVDPQASKASQTSTASKAASTPGFEEHLAAVERAIRQLEAGDIPLEDSIDLYAGAMEHLKQCHTVLDRAERRLEVVRRTAEGGVRAVPAEVDDARGLRDGGRSA